MKKKIKILFIGNSLTYYNFLPECVRRMLECDGIKSDCVMLTAPGKCLKYHSEHPDTKYNILYGHYDYIVLQGVADGFYADEFGFTYDALMYVELDSEGNETGRRFMDRVITVKQPMTR